MTDLKIAAIVLAAGQSKRFGQDNKLFAPYHGVPLIDHCMNIVLGFEFHDRIVVRGYEQERIEAHIDNMPARSVFNPYFEGGMGTSLATGVNALAPDIDAFMVFLADMPDVSPNVLNQITTAYQSNKYKSIVRPVHQGKPGHPVLFDASHRDELRFLTRDQGASEIIRQHSLATLDLEVPSAAIGRDVDTLNDLDA